MLKNLVNMLKNLVNMLKNLVNMLKGCSQYSTTTFMNLCCHASDEEILDFYLKNSHKININNIFDFLCQTLSINVVKKIYEMYKHKSKLIMRDNGHAIFEICKKPKSDDFEEKYDFISKLYKDRNMDCVTIFTSLFVEIAKYGRVDIMKYIFNHSRSLIDTHTQSYGNVLEFAFKIAIEYWNFDVAKWLLSFNDFDILPLIKSACCANQIDLIKETYDKWVGCIDINTLLYYSSAQCQYNINYFPLRHYYGNNVEVVKFLWTNSNRDQRVLWKSMHLAKKYCNHLTLLFLYSELENKEKAGLLFTPKYFRSLLINKNYELAIRCSNELSELFEVNTVADKIVNFTVKTRKKIIKYELTDKYIKKIKD